MQKTKIAIFDIDGTIFRKNLAFELINELAWMKIFSHKVRDTLTEVYTNWLEHEGTYEEYRKALVELYVKNIKGCSRDDVLKASRIVVPFHAKRTYIFAERLIKKFRSENYHIIAVSGSPIEVVEEYNSRYLQFDHVFGSVYELDKENRYTGVAQFEPSANKGAVVEQYMQEHKLNFQGSYGVGDTESDVSFLKLVEYPIAFNPNQNLNSVAQKEKWRVVVEKKDVIYEIAENCFREPQI